MNIKLFSKFLKALFTLAMALIMALLNLQPARAASVCYVNASASSAGSGASWADVYTDLQSALGASLCTEVWVAAGTYKPTSGLDRAISFTLKNGVALYGGFAGTETQLSQRNPATNLTILSGDIGVASSAADNSYHVINGGGTDGTAVLDGFTVKDGKANGSDPADSGGGMYNLSSSPSLANVIFSSNSATIGGGIFNNGSNPTLTNVTFNINSASEGGGIYNKSSSNPTLMNVTINGNAAQYGGGMLNNNSNPTLTSVTFSGNSADSGGGMFNTNSSNPTLTNVTFSNNSATSSSVGSGGGGMFNGSNSSPTLTNVTFSGNSASSSGGGMFNGSSSPQVRDSIFWGDSASVTGGEIYNNPALPASPNLADSVVAGGCPSGATCVNIITTNPLLGPLANNGGFTQTRALLGIGSSAVDAGNDATCASVDQRGVARPKGAHCDIGAYEWIYYQVYLPLVMR